MKIHFNGAAQTVTGSQYLLEVNGSRLLLECGMYQGKREESYARNRTFSFPLDSLDAAILSHAHIDHSGNLPNLVKLGYHGPIYATPATCKLADLMLRDSGHIQEADVEFVNRKRAEHGEPPVEPLYTLADAAEVQKYLRPVSYDASFEPVEGVTARLVEAGHILGSAAVVLDICEKGRQFRLWFSGDVGRMNLPLLRDPVLPEGADYLLMESTYGNKLHSDPEAAYIELRQSVLRTIDRKGKVIVPAFAVGRTQELVYDLNRMVTGKEIPPIPVYVDSPLAVGASTIFQQSPECFDEETRQFVQSGRHPALSFPDLTYIQSVEESKALNGRRDPMVIISASGMAETGRILHHLKNNIEDDRNMVLIVGWQAPDTLGRRLADRAPRVRIFGEEYERRAEVVTIGGFSAHAGQNLLVQYALACQRSLKHIYLVHGEPDAAGALSEKIRQNQATPLSYPELYSVVEI